MILLKKLPFYLVFFYTCIFCSRKQWNRTYMLFFFIFVIEILVEMAVDSSKITVEIVLFFSFVTYYPPQEKK